MAIISKQTDILRTPRGLRRKILFIYALMLGIVLVIVNIYPARIMERQIVDTARDNMLSDVTALSSILRQSSELSPDTISSAIGVLRLDEQNRRIIVTDPSGLVLYDSLSKNSVKGKVVVYAEIITALGGEDVFYCIHEEGAFDEWAAAPIMRGNLVEGAVYFYQQDVESAKLLGSVESNIRLVSFAALGLSIVAMLIFNRSLGKRFSAVLVGVREAGSGNFNYRIKMKGSDELTQIAGEFNELSHRIQRSETARRQFVADASHELKTPLASIKLLSDSISQNKNISRDTVDEFLGDIGNEIDRLIRISEELIAINKADFTAEENYVCNMADTVERAADRLRIKAETAQVDLQVSCEGDCAVFATDDGIYHIVFNLIENAIKYNRKEGRVTVTLKRVEDNVVFAVEDTGIGIPLHEQKRVFERFFRVDKNRSRATGGTGLGLSIVKEWTDKLGGEITLKSTYGEGSVFKVVLTAYTGEAGV